MKLRSLGMIACMGAVASLCLTSTKAEALLASVKTVGRALTQTAYPEDTQCSSVNPAGEAFIGNRWDSGINFEHRRQSCTISGNTATVPVAIPGDGVVFVPVPGVNGHFVADKTKTYYSPDFGINYEFGCDNEYSVGLSFYNRAFLKTTYNINFPLFGTSNLGLEYVNQQLSPFVTYKINNCHAIGVAFNINVSRLKVRGLEQIASPTFTGPDSLHPTKVTNRGNNYATGYGVTVGYLGKLTDNFSFGVAFTPETYFKKYDRYTGFLAQGRLNLPWRVNVGIAWRLAQNATIAFDVEHEAFNNTRSLHNKINLPNPFSPLLGSKRGTGFGWKGRTTYRLGGDYRFCNSCDSCYSDLLNNLTIRAGVRYATPLFRGNQNVVNILTDETGTTAATCGFTYDFGCGQEFSAYYAHIFFRRVKGINAIPEEFGGGNATLRQRQNVWGISYGREF